MNKNVITRTWLIINSFLMVVCVYGFMKRDIFWDTYLFRKVNLPSSVVFHFKESAPLFYPREDAGGDLYIWKPSDNQGPFEFLCTYNVNDRTISIESPSQYVNLSQTEIYKDDANEYSFLDETELFEFFSSLVNKNTKIVSTSFSKETVWSGRECYDIYHINGEIKGTIITYSSGAGLQHHIHPIPVDWTDYESVHAKRLFSEGEMVISVTISIVITVIGGALLRKKKNRQFVYYSSACTIGSLIVAFLGIVFRL